jgi:photosystem II stability/assembly factor-like uncharacterized protein
MPDYAARPASSDDERRFELLIEPNLGEAFALAQALSTDRSSAQDAVQSDANHDFTMGLTGNNNPSTVLWTTTDGGMTWAQAPNGAIHGNGPFETSQLDFISPRIGWVVSVDIVVGGIVGPGQTPYPTLPPELWQTTDAGSTWTLITPTFTTSR